VIGTGLYYGTQYFFFRTFLCDYLFIIIYSSVLAGRLNRCTTRQQIMNERDERRKGGGTGGRQRGIEGAKGEKEGSQGRMDVEGEGKDVVREQKEGKEESETQVGAVGAKGDNKRWQQQQWKGEERKKNG
jgi:hypothetical protein